MIDVLKHRVVAHGDRLKMLSIKRLQDLKNEVERFKKNEELNGFQQWIVSQMYQFEAPPAEFAIKSILIVAVRIRLCQNNVCMAGPKPTISQA